MTNYNAHIDTLSSLRQSNLPQWQGINSEYAARMQLQNRFKTGLDIAKYTAKVMREDMAAFTTVIQASTRNP